MIATTFDDRDVFLIPYAPEWGPSAVQVTFEKLVTKQAGLSQREERASLAATLRVPVLKYKAVIETDQADTLRTIIATWDNRSVLCPFWPAESLIGEESAASVQGGLRVWYEPDWSAWEIGTGTSPSGFTPSSECRTAPVVWGRFDVMPSSQIVDGHDDELVTFSIVENGPVDYALSGKSVTLVNGTSVNGQAVPLLQTAHGFAWGGNSQTIEIRVERERVGFGRTELDSTIPQTPRRVEKLIFDWLEQDDAAYILRLFDNRGGSVLPIWTIAAHSLTERAYGRFYGDRLTIEWELPARCGERSSCKIDFISLPTEQAIPSGETYGATIGPVDKPWLGYEITDGAITWRATSYESPVVGPGGTYTPRVINHGRIVDEINLPANSCQLTVEHWAGGPFGRLMTNPRSLSLVVKIYEGTIANPTAAEVVYTGTANKPKARGAANNPNASGSKMVFQLEGLGGRASAEGPRCMMTKDCQAVYGDSKCKKDLAPLRLTADLLSFADGVAKIDANAADYDPNFFADGYVDRPISGGAAQRYEINASYDFGDGKLALELLGDVLPAPSGVEADWILTPGCPGTKTACIARSNLVNFRGFPEMPPENPTIVALPQSSTGGKKG